jgi:hypothetical protein
LSHRPFDHLEDVSEKAVVVVSIKYVHQLEIDIVFRFLNLFGALGISCVIVHLFRRIAAVTIGPAAVFDNAPIA